MQVIRTWSFWLASPVLVGASLTLAADGEIQQVCNCRRGMGGAGFAASAMPGYMPPAPGAAPQLLPYPSAPPLQPAPVEPPPGTLGRTYSLPTRLIPADKHPRVAMLDIRTSAEEVFVSDTMEFREEDDVDGFQDQADATVWHFETKPLLPGVPHVYKVELVNGGVTTDVRYVRLIRGRIFELSF